MDLIILDQADVRRLLPKKICIELMEKAFRSGSDGTAKQELRQIFPLDGESGDCYGLMPGFLKDPACFGAKVTSVFPGNFGSELQSHQGVIVLFERARGQPVAIIHGGEVTAIRTASASAVATRALARPDAQTIAILGYGEQAVEHIEALLCLRPYKEIRIWGRSFERATGFARRMAALHPCDFLAVRTVREATLGADIVCTLTAAAEPILGEEALQPGMHLNVVGSSVARFREVEDAVVARATLFVDLETMTRQEGGEFRSALRAGLIDETHIAAEMGEVLLGRHPGRRSPEEITLFKSLGMPAEDLTAAHYLYERALALGAGTRVAFRDERHRVRL